MKTKIIISASFVILFLYSCLFLRSLPLQMDKNRWNITYNTAVFVQEFAQKHNHLFFHKKYKAEIEEYISSAVPEAEKELDKIVSDAQKYGEDYKKNTNKELIKEEFENKLYDYERSLESPEFWLYVELSKIQDKYLLIPIGGLPTDWIGPYADILLPYFNKYGVDDSKLNALGKYYSKKLKEIRELHDISSKPIQHKHHSRMQLIHGYPKEAIYYYYSDNFNPISFEKPKEVKIADGHYTIFVYDQQKNKSDFESDADGVIEDTPGYMYSMLTLGVNHKPKYYIRRHRECMNDYNGKCIDICEFNKDSNVQIKYTVNPWSGEIIKQLEFDNGAISFPNLCNPDWIPETDI